MASPRAGRPPHAQADAGFWSSLSPTARHASALGALLLLSVAFFWSIHFGGKGLHGSDIVNWRGMAEAMIQYEEATGEDALWAPNLFGGMPGYLVNYKPEVPQLDTLVNAIRSFAWPTSHLFLLMAGTYALVVYLTRNGLAGLFAGAAFGFTTYLPIILAAGHQTKFVALAYAPLVLLAFAYAMRRPSLLSGLLFAAALALQLRAKHPQITFYVGMVILVWWIVHAVATAREESPDWTPFLQSTGALAGGTVLGLLMVIQPYWATYEYKQFSTRAAQAAAGGGDGGGSAMAWDYAMRWSQGVGELVTLVIADAFGGGGGTYWGPKPFTAGPHYVGGVVVALAGLAAWRLRSRLSIGLAAAAVVTMLFSLGRHFEALNRLMFEVFPFFDAFRAPETWLSISALCLIVLAGLGLDHVLRTSDRKQDRADEATKTKAVAVAFGVVFGLVGLLYVGHSAVFSFEKPNEEQQLARAIQQQRPDLSIDNPRVQQFIRQRIAESKTERREAFKADAARTLFALGAVFFVLWMYRRKGYAAWAAGALVVLVVVIDLWGVDRRYLGEEELSPQREVEAQIPTYAFDQWIKERVREAGGSGHFRVLPLALNPMNNAIPSYHYESVGGYHGAKLQRFQEYADHILQVTQPGPPNENAIDLLNTRYIIARQQLPGTQVAFRDSQSGMLVLENPDAVPRGYFVGETEVIERPQATWQRLRSPEFNPRTTAVLPEPLDATVTPMDSTSVTSATLQKHTPREIQWTVQTDAPRLFVASEIYYPAGWTATLDGETVPIHRVNYLLRGVPIPAGEHTLTMRFDPAADRVGTWIAALATALDYGGILWLAGVPYIRRRWLEE